MREAADREDRTEKSADFTRAAGPGARAARRDAPRAEAAEGSARRVQEDDGQGAEPVPRAGRSGGGRRAVGRPRGVAHVLSAVSDALRERRHARPLRARGRARRRVRRRFDSASGTPRLSAAWATRRGRARRLPCAIRVPRDVGLRDDTDEHAPAVDDGHAADLLPLHQLQAVVDTRVVRDRDRRARSCTTLP